MLDGRVLYEGLIHRVLLCHLAIVLGHMLNMRYGLVDYFFLRHGAGAVIVPHALFAELLCQGAGAFAFACYGSRGLNVDWYGCLGCVEIPHSLGDIWYRSLHAGKDFLHGGRV